MLSLKKKPPAEPDRLAELRAIEKNIQRHWAELDRHLDAYVRLVTPVGLPVTTAKMQYLIRGGHCLCHAVTFALDEQKAAIELERRQMKEEATS
jgi:hypothetical protein